VRRYLEAGLVIFGKTNLPELALKGVTDSQLFGRASNPWNVEHTPGAAGLQRLNAAICSSAGLKFCGSEAGNRRELLFRGRIISTADARR
jgi:amidase